MIDLEVSRITTAQEMEEALAVRRAVFVQEQNVPIEIEIDEHDGDPETISSALHVLGRSATGTAVATGRLLLNPSEPGTAEVDRPPAHIGRVAVLASYRHHGWGRALMEALQKLAREQGYPRVDLAAQLHALAFYEHLGYLAHGPVFLEAGIEHREMSLRL